MTRIVFGDFFLLLNEWKDIVDRAESVLEKREDSKGKIDRIIAELKKPLPTRDIDSVKNLIDDLKKEKSIGKYVGSSANIIIELCSNN